MNILLTTAEWKGTLACMRSLARLGHRVVLLSKSKFTPHIHSKYCKESIITPREEEREVYINFLFEVLKKNKFDLVVPMSDMTVEYFSEMRNEIFKYTKLILPKKESVDIASRKDMTYRFALENKISIPKTFFPQNMEDVKKISNDSIYPCYIKYSKGAGGLGNRLALNKESLLFTFTNLKNIQDWPVIQVFAKGRYGNFVGVCDQGEIISYFIYESIRQYPEKSGPNVYSLSFYDEDALKFSLKIVKALNWTGPINFDFIMKKNNEILLIDINPRFPGSLQAASGSGVDLPSKLLEIVDGRAKKCLKKNYRENVLYRAVFLQEIHSCIENKKYFFNFFINFFRLNTCYDFSIFDYRLLWWQLKQAKWMIEESEGCIKEEDSFKRT